VDFAASSLGAYDGVVNVVGNLNPAISGFPKPLSTRWPKRVLPQQPQVNETNAQEIWVRAGQPVYVLRRVDLLRSFRSHGIDIRIGLQFRQSAVEILAMQNRYLY